MNEIGQKIREVRKKKGLSQEVLIESSKINSRTIQRIENNESEQWKNGKPLSHDHKAGKITTANTDEIIQVKFIVQNTNRLIEKKPSPPK